jgi:pantoate--beta-alanine ligase
MKIIKTIKQMQALSRRLKAENKTIGFVPTMGALHEGHLSLVRRSTKECDSTVVSIFVNPTQFGPQEDFKQYPRDLEGDLKKLSIFNIDAVFTPDNEEMYPEGFSTNIKIGHLGEILCGMSRPGHFNGVATVVTKLFNIVIPHRAYFGQKDFQQSVVIKKLVKELNFDIEIIVCPIVREPDGLAMSSRNSYLNTEERKKATVLYRALLRGEECIKQGMKDSLKVREEMEKLIKAENVTAIDYIEVVDPESLESVKQIDRTVVICLAVKIGTTRLIDNKIIEIGTR